VFGRRMLAAMAVALSSVLISTAAVGVPSEEDIDEVERQAEETRASVSDVEVELARKSIEYDEVVQRAQIAAETYNSAQEDLAEAEEAVEEAQEELTEATKELDEARSFVADIAMSAYRNGGSFSQLSMFLEADGITEVLDAADGYSMLGSRADEAQQVLDAATRGADVAKQRADEALEERQEASEAVEAAYADTTLQVEAAEQSMAEIEAEREELLGQLASLRDTTVEMERERQDHLDEQRRQREEQAAEEEEQRREEQERSQSREESRESSPSPSPSGSSSSSSSPSPSPSRTSSPSPSPTRTSSPSPSPSRTSSPSPSPSRTSSPSPSPSPTSSSKPKPKPSTPPPSSSSAGQKALAWARTQLGKPYVWGAAGPSAYDCSGLTMAAFKQAGVSLPRNSAAQYGVGTKVPVSELKAGDLIFYSNNGAQSGIYHVAFYAGNNMRVHAPSPGKSVEEVPMYRVNLMPYGVRL